MEAESLPDGRVRLVLSLGENRLLSYSLSETYAAARIDSEFRAHAGVSETEAGSLYDEWQILRRELFDLSKPHEYESEASRAWRTEESERLSKGPRETGTAWDDLPKMGAEPLPDRRVAYTLARGELSISAGAIDVMLAKVARDRDMSSRNELFSRSGETIEDFEALRDELWQADLRLRGAPKPSPLYDPPRPKASSGRVGDVATFAAQHRLARVLSRQRGPVGDERMKADLTPDGRARIVVSVLRLQRLWGAFWPWHRMYWDEPDFVGPGGASARQAEELRFEIHTIRLWLDEKWRDRWARKGVALCEVRDGRIVPLDVSTEDRRAWGEVPVTEAEALPDGHTALILPLVKLGVLAGYLEVYLGDPERYERFYGYITQEQSEALADDLWLASEDLSDELAKREGHVEIGRGRAP
jgi:hypothetical protein